ncbi:MerR family transcriptional regulator [Thiohalorhabdus sp. Cl-TMA]|uniref:MerR family transcriptional regulator n=1 Tax=Thiohalorhabdus methylotrophus TaxID=3242694 RepID=A0ABV4TRF9_9GAMM
MGLSNKTAATREAGLYPIRTVASMTGVKPVTLRAWERRYGLLRPRRTPKGHRMYSRADVERIQTILELLEEGIPIGQIRTVLDLPGARFPEDPESVEAGGWIGFRNRLLESISGFEEGALESVHNEALALYPAEVVNRYLVQPILEDLAERRVSMPEREGELFFFLAYLRNKLGERYLHQRAQSAGPRLMLAGLPESDSELDLMSFALIVQDGGYRPVLMGTNVPTEALVGATDRARAGGLVLFSGPAPPPGLIEEEGPWLAERVRVPLYLSGRNARRRLQGQSWGRALPPDPREALTVLDADLKRAS